MKMNTPNYIVSLKVKPLLVRKPVTSNVTVIVNPSQGKISNIRHIDNKKPVHQNNIPKDRIPIPKNIDNQPIRINQNQPPKPKRPNNAAVAGAVKRNSLQQPKTKVLHRDIDEDSREKIRQLRDVGRNKSLFIIGNGPSINNVDFKPFKNNEHIDIMSINKPEPRCWPSKYWAFFDSSQLRRNEELWNSYQGIIFNSTGIKKTKTNALQIKNLGGKGFSKDLLKGFNIGRSSVYAAMQIAMWMNYKHIFIFGCDMNPDGVDGKLHFYGDNPDVKPEIRKERFKKEAEYYSHAATILTKEDRSRFYFVSSYNHWPFVSEYNKIDHLNCYDIINDLISK